MIEEELPQMANYIVTCGTGGCMNEGIPIPVVATATDPTVICGPCGQTITSVVPQSG